MNLIGSTLRKKIGTRSLEAAHVQLDQDLGEAGELRKITMGDLKKAVVDLTNDRLLADLLVREAILDHNGTVDVAATVFKLRRRAFVKALPASDARLAPPQWANRGNSDEAPRGTGPKARPPIDQARMFPDRGNVVGETVTAAPVITSAGILSGQAPHDPVKALEILRQVIATTRRAQGLPA